MNGTKSFISFGLEHIALHTHMLSSSLRHVKLRILSLSFPIFFNKNSQLLFRMSIDRPSRPKEGGDGGESRAVVFGNVKKVIRSEGVHLPRVSPLARFVMLDIFQS